MSNLPVTLKQTKKRVPLFVIATLVVGILGIFLRLHYELGVQFNFDLGHTPIEVWVAIALIVLMLLVAYLFVPVATIELSHEGFTYSKGKKTVKSNWSEVEGIYKQRTYSPWRPSLFFIITQSNQTPYINPSHFYLGDKILKIPEFEKLLEFASGKEIVLSDYSLEGIRAKGNKKIVIFLLVIIFISFYLIFS